MKKGKMPYLLILPHVLMVMIFVAGILHGMVQSVGIVPSLNLTDPTVQYYRDLVNRGDFISSLTFSLYIALVSALLSVTIGTFLCVLLVRLRKTKGWVLRIIQIPIVVPHVVVAFFVIYFVSQNGLFARLFYHAGLISGQEEFALMVFDQRGVGIILAYLWKEVPFIVYFVISLMASIDEGLGEASMNLGAGKIRTFFRITLPLCFPTIAGGFLILFTYALGAYELPYILGATQPKALPILSYIYYTHPDLQMRPYAMAVNGVIVIVALIAGALYGIIKRRAHENF